MKQIPTSVMAVTFALSMMVGSNLIKEHRTRSSKTEPVPLEVVEFVPPVVTEVTCHGCSDNELKAAKFFYDQGITDRLALATVMGNIKQESKFFPNICEGGARVPYEQCHKGGYGLIQWTTTARYNGLGSFAKKYGGDPSSLNTQLRYVTNETQWQKFLPRLKEPGHTIEHYMRYAFYWLGWGVHGQRTNYAYDYSRRLELP